MSQKESIKAFEALGFTTVESEVYVYLVQNSPATGYAIAKAIGRTKGATYKVLSSLEGRGAIIANEDKKGLFRAIPPDELLKRLERDFLREKNRALYATKKLKASPADDRIYRLTTIEQVYERCRTMLDECVERAVIDIFPEPFGILRDDIQAAIDRGVKVMIHLYEPSDIRGARTVVPDYVEDVTSVFPADYICICQDDRQFLIAAVSGREKRVYNAYWSSNPLYSWTFSIYVKQSLLGAHFETLLGAGATRKDMKKSLEDWHDYLPSFTSVGYKAVKDLLESGTENS